MTEEEKKEKEQKLKAKHDKMLLRSPREILLA